MCVGANVILLLNAVWGVSTVLLGLMNGARGVVVAILYCAPNGKRVDLGAANLRSGLQKFDSVFHANDQGAGLEDSWTSLWLSFAQFA